MKYFEAGHTFISANSFHDLVEKSMKHIKQSKIFDFNDFKEATVKASCKNVKEIVMDLDFFFFLKMESHQSIKKISTFAEKYEIDFTFIILFNGQETLTRLSLP